MFGYSNIDAVREPWKKGKLIGQKQPFTPQQIWSIRMHPQAAGNPRDLVLFNRRLESRLRACDLRCLRVNDVASGDKVQSGATIRQRKTKRPVRLLSGHSKLDSTVRYLGIEIDDALEMSERIDV